MTVKERKGLNIQLKRLRTDRGMTQKELADRLKIGQTAIANYESGKRFPDEKNLIKLADCFGISIDSLLGRKMAPRESIVHENSRAGFNYSPSGLENRKSTFMERSLLSTHEGTEFILSLLQAGYSEEQILIDLIETSLIETGIKWAEGVYNEAMEHQISAAALQAMYMMKSVGEKHTGGRGRSLSIVAAGENHNIGLRMLSRFLEIDGWDNLFFESSVPGIALKDFIEETRTGLVLVSLTLNQNTDAACSLIRAVKSLNPAPAVAAGGAATAINKKQLINAGADHISRSVPETIEWTRRLQSATKNIR